MVVDVRDALDGNVEFSLDIVGSEFRKVTAVRVHVVPSLRGWVFAKDADCVVSVETAEDALHLNLLYVIKWSWFLGGLGV